MGVQSCEYACATRHVCDAARLVYSACQTAAAASAPLAAQYLGSVSTIARALRALRCEEGRVARGAWH